VSRSVGDEVGEPLDPVEFMRSLGRRRQESSGYAMTVGKAAVVTGPRSVGQHSGRAGGRNNAGSAAAARPSTRRQHGLGEQQKDVEA